MTQYIIELFGYCIGSNFNIISGRGSAHSSANEGKSGFIYNLVKEIISCLSAQTCTYFMKIMTVYTLNSDIFTLKAHITKYGLVVCYI